MTPFGRRIRELRTERGVTQRQMAAALGVSPAWLSALEKGNRGRPSWEFLQRVIAYFNVIWDDADELVELARISHPRIIVDTSRLSAEATELANLVAERIGELSADDLNELIHDLKVRTGRHRRAG
ncbi:MAG: transcriptional regulator [Alphaproteobacteria bacterium]|nr:MAG: transcriptional regulator [Alphaproteobacteria bacterium]